MLCWTASASGHVLQSMPRHLVFVGAPTPDITRVTYPELSASHRWHTVVEDDSPAAHEFAIPAASVTDAYYKLPPATLEEASRRISRLYENIIFGDIEDPEDENVAVLDESRMHDTRGTIIYVAHPSLASVITLTLRNRTNNFDYLAAYSTSRGRR